MNKLDAMKQVGNEWQKGDHHRIYFNFEYSDLGLDISYYKSGNVSYAKYDGEKISNSQARRMMSWTGKIFYDVNEDKMKTQYWKDDELEQRAIDWVYAQLEKETNAN